MRKRATAGLAAVLLASVYGPTADADGPDARVGLQLVRGPGEGVVRGAVNWYVHEYKRGHGMGRRVADLSGATTSVRLAAGTYELEIVHPGGRMDHAIQVTAGAHVDYTLVAKP